MRPRYALISVWNKQGLIDFARGLKNLGIKILSTGGTARLLKEAGMKVLEVSSYTGFPEMLEGRVKTLHPKIHAGILALREKISHMKELTTQKIFPIDMVVIDLYPFQEVIKKKSLSLKEATENIDIGGVTLLRAGAKNFKNVAVISSPSQYKPILKELIKNKGRLSLKTLKELSIGAFKKTLEYDMSIYAWLKERFKKEFFSDKIYLSLRKKRDLRYGENPHQRAAYYTVADKELNIIQLQGKELSYNNLLDIDSAYRLIREFNRPAAVVIKHTNPCGVAEKDKLYLAYRAAYRCDPLSSFGGIVGLNKKLDLKTAQELLKSGFLECIIAPDYEKEALKILRKRKNLRILKFYPKGDFDYEARSLRLGFLLQEEDKLELLKKNLRVVTKKRPTPSQMKTLLFAWKVVKHVKSNAIVLAKGTQTVGIGAGQMSRVDSVVIATQKAKTKAKGACLSSDAFFPKEDAIRVAARAGIKAIIQPGGSIRDREVIATANRYNICMLFTGIRHFRH